MPDQFGNPTPQEILAEIAAQNMNMVGSANTSSDRRNAQLFALGRTLSAGYSPQMIQARKREDAVGKSLALARGESESALDYEIRKGRDLYSRLIDVDQTAAIEVAQTVLELEEERKQQGHLKQQESRNVEQHEAQMTSYRDDAAVGNAEGLRYAYDPKTGASVPGEWTHVKDMADALITQKEWQARGLIPVDREQLFSLTRQAGDAEAHRSIINNSSVDRHYEIGANYVSQALLGKEIISGMADALEAGANPVTGAEKFAVAAQGLVNTFDEVRRALHMDENTGQVDPTFKDTPRPGSQEFSEDMARVQLAINERQIQTSLPLSFLTLYIYSVAKTQDARVTNMDFTNIEATLRAVSGDPTQIGKIIERQTELTQRGLALTSREMAIKWMTEHPKGSEAHNDGDLILGPINRGDEVLDEMRQETIRLGKVWNNFLGGGGPGGRARVVGENE